MKIGEAQTAHTICNIDGIHFYYEINPFYIDNLNKKVVGKFIDEIYTPYYKQFGNNLEGFFTDEPQLATTGIPWSLILPEEYKKEYNRDLLPDLIHLFKPIGAYKQTRKMFYRLVTKLFSEAFAKQIYEWQMARGINLLCQHLQGYSIRGIRKRDYPPAMYYQQPWWEEYKLFNDSMSRIGMLITEGKPDCNTLLIHPQTTAWICYDCDKNYGLSEYEEKFKNIIDILEKKHIQFHLGDELIMERHGRIEGDKLIIGEMEYTNVVIPPNIDFLENTQRLLKEFKNNGGKIITATQAQANPIIDNPEITYLKRRLDKFDMHYFVNSTDKYQTAQLNVNGVMLDIMTGEEMGFDKNHTFNPYDSLVILDYRNGSSIDFNEKELNELHTNGKWQIVDFSDNAITLDVCDCYFDGELIGKDISVSEIQGKACDLGRAVNIRCVFNIDISFLPNNICLVCETPEIFTYKINNKDINFNDTGYFRDKSFRKTNISKHLKTGINTIELICNFKQSTETYDNIKKASGFEVIKNKLTYDMEVENIYVIGDFSVRTDGKFEKLDKNAVRYMGRFVIDKPIKEIALQNIEQQGFPFFSGKLTVKKSFDISDINQKLFLNTKGINAVKIKVNDKVITTEIWNICDIDLSEHLKIGKNIIELTLIKELTSDTAKHFKGNVLCHAVCLSSGHFIPLYRSFYLCRHTS